MAILAVLLPFLLLASSSRANPIFDTEALVEEAQQMNYRLPGNSIPESYTITLTPDLETFTYTGESVIFLKVAEQTRDITLHARGLEIDPKGIVLKFDTTDANKPVTKVVPLMPEPFELVPEKEFIVIKTKGDLEKGTYHLTIKYSGKLSDSTRGFYRSSYVNDKGQERWLAVTQFEPTSARLAFPCYDEPALKATFKLTIVHDDQYRAISNTPVDGTPKVEKGIKTTIFKETPKMSTYLVAFAVSDYTKKGDDQMAVWTKKSAVDDIAYALDFGKKEITALGKLLGISYFENVMNMQKLDQISVPHFGPGAMENWGLVTYRESALFYDEEKSTTASLQGTATVIAHEFAHQWFGNLVSPKWWKYIWLNEGFATYFQYAGGDEVEDTWRLMEQFVVNAMQSNAFAIDGSENARPLNKDVDSPQEIAALFDAVAYQKGGSIIRMMEHILTKKVFYEGLLNYLTKYKNSVADSDNLFASLQVAVDEAAKSDKKYKKIDVAKTMDNWVNKAGYPIINVRREKKKMVITQEQFPIPESKEDNKWVVPINYVIGEEDDFEDTIPVAFLEAEEDAEYEVAVPEDSYIIVNKQQTGYYRVNYDSKNWELITKQLKGNNFTDIHVLNRAQLVDDALNLARVGKLDYTIVLELFSYLEKETDFIAWVPAFRELEHLNKMLVNSKQHSHFKNFIAKQLKALVAELTFEPRPKEDSHTDKLARVPMLKWACAFGNKDCVKYVNEKLEAYLKDAKKAKLDVNLKHQILCAALKNADEKKWNSVFEAYKKSSDSNEKTVLLSSLGCSESLKILTNFAELMFNDTQGVEDPHTAFMALLVSNTHGVDIGLEALAQNIDTIRELDDGETKLKKYITELGSRITTVEQQTKLGLLVASEGIPKETSAAAIQNTFKNLYWVQSYEEKVAKWLTEHMEEKKEEESDDNAGNSASFVTCLILLPILITRFF